MTPQRSHGSSWHLNHNSTDSAFLKHYLQLLVRVFFFFFWYHNHGSWTQEKARIYTEKQPTQVGRKSAHVGRKPTQVEKEPVQVGRGDVPVFKPWTVMEELTLLTTRVTRVRSRS